jgi:hypothetical protein
MLPQPTYPTESVESGWELLMIMGGGPGTDCVLLDLDCAGVLEISQGEEGRQVADRKGKTGRWDSLALDVLVLRGAVGGVPQLEAAEQSARHHTDHCLIDRRGWIDRLGSAAVRPPAAPSVYGGFRLLLEPLVPGLASERIQASGPLVTSGHYEGHEAGDPDDGL